MKLSRHALTVLTRQYRSVLLKCALINAGLFFAVSPAMAEVTVVTGIGSTQFDNMAVSSDGTTITDTVSINVNPTVTTTASLYDKTEIDTKLDAKQNKLTNADNGSSSIQVSSTGVISVANGGITNAMIAGNAVKTGSIEDGNVTKAKLATDVQTSLGKADSALQAGDITTGTTNGTIKVGSTEVAVAGLGTAAYKADTYFATAAQGAKADSALQAGDITTGTTNGTIKVGSTEVSVAGLGTAAYKADTYFQTAITSTNMLDADLVDDSTSTHKFVTAAEKTQIATNASNITTLQGDVLMDGAAQSTAGYAAGAKVDAAVAAIDGALKTAEGNITTLQTDVTQLKADVVMDNDHTSSANYAAGAKVDVAVAAIDAALKADETRLTTAESSITDLTTNTSTGAINVKEANIGATGLTSAGDIKTTGSGNIVSAGNISTTNGTISGKNGSFSGDLGVTGTATAGTLAVTNNATVGGTFGVTGVTTLGDDLQGTTATFTGKVNTVGLDAGSGNIKTTAKVDAGSLEVTGASVMKGGLTIESGSTPKVTLGTDGTIVATGKITSVGLDAGNGAITTTGTLSAGAATVTSLTSTGAISGTTGTFSGLLSANSGLTVTGASALNGDTTVKGTFGAGSDGTKFTIDANGNVTKAGTIAATGLTTTASTTALGGTGYTNTITGVTQLDATDGMKFGASGNVAKAIDNGASARTKTTANNDTTLATVASVLKSAENADFTAASGAFNVATGTINGAITSLDTAVGSRADWTKDDTNNALTVGTALVANSSLADAVSQLNVNIGANVTTTTNGVAATKTVNANIDALNTAMGDVSGVSVNGYTPGDLVGAVNKLDANMDAVLGAVYKADGSYDNTQLQGNGFKKATTDLTDELSSYAGNIATAFGGSFDATSGAWASGVTAKTATSYTGSVVPTTVADTMDKIAQVTYNMGTAAELTTTGVNGVNTAKTVNANIDALNIVIGDMTTLATNATAAGSATSGDALTNGTGVAPATVVAGLNNLSYTIGNIHNLKAEGSHLGANSNLASGTTVEQHLVSLDDAIGDRSFATTHYIAPHDDLSTAVTKLDNELHTLNHDVRKLRHDMDRGLASVSALSALIPNARGTGNTTVSVGTGYYNGHSSMALGGAHWFTDNLMVNIGAATSLDRTRNATYRAGLSYSF